MQSYTRTYGTPPSTVRGEFFLDTELNPYASEQAGRPIYRELERVRIITPGNNGTIVVQNVNDGHKERWPDAYTAFKNGREMPLSGTPLEEWPILTKAMVYELRHLQIRTVEELANLDDLGIQRIGMGGRDLRDRAAAFIDDGAREALVSRVTAENERLNAQVIGLEHQVKELGAHLERLDRDYRTLRDRPNPVATFIQGDNDPMEAARVARVAAEPPAQSAIAGLPPMRRRPRTEEELPGGIFAGAVEPGGVQPAA